MRNIDVILAELAKSPFRRRFRLGPRERTYFDEKGLATIMSHAADFIAKRLAPAAPRNYGKQTPMRDHPVFVAQHAAATCCRGCLAKWHGITAGHALTGDEQAYVLAVLERRLRLQVEETEPQ